MKAEEYGKENDKTIVMLHGAHFVHTFGRQYPLAEKYRIIVPHIMGFGAEADRVFETEQCVSELAAYISGLDKKAMLVGFSLGAQLAFKLASQHKELFSSVILVSPWLIKEEPFLSEIYKENIKQLASLKNKRLCRFTAMVNGLPRPQRAEFVEQMQKEKEETVKNIVYNDISIESAPGFRDLNIPITALAGEKEQGVMRESVKKLSEINPNCKCEIWQGAGHNIPPVYAKRFNALLCSMADEPVRS